MNVLISKLEGGTYKAVGKKYGISSDQVLERILLRTACGKFWSENMKGGEEPIFSILDTEKFVSYSHSNLKCLDDREKRQN